MSIDVELFKRSVRTEAVFDRYFGIGKQKRMVRCISKSHKDSHPSMSIDSGLGLYYCHSCGFSGDVISLVQFSEGLSFRQAISFLSSLSGVSDPFQGIEYKESPIEVAQRFYIGKLWDSQAALRFLEERGISLDWASSLGIGFAPYSTSDFMEMVKSKNADFSRLIDNNGRPKLVGRITFPVYDRLGTLIGFIGRSIRDEAPKYYKTAEMGCVYGLNLINRFSGPAIIVEGPIDHAVLTQNGFKSIATMGIGMIYKSTLSSLRQHGNKAYLYFDYDEAGAMATAKSIPVLYSLGILPMVVEAKKDPDETLLELGADRFRDMLSESKTAAQWIATKYKGIDALDLFRKTITHCQDESLAKIEMAHFTKESGIPVTAMASSSSGMYDHYILDCVKLYPELYTEVMNSECPIWIKDAVMSGAAKEFQATIPTEVEVRHGLRRILRASMETHSK